MAPQPLSPVLQAFLGGQKQQSDLMQTAQGIINQQEQRKQQQQQLDDVMRRFTVSSKQEQDRMDDQHELMNIHKRMSEYDMQDKIRDMFKNGQMGQSAPVTAPANPNTTGIPALDMSPQTNRDYTYSSPVTGQDVTMHNLQFPADFQNQAQQGAVGMQAALAPGNLVAKQADQDIVDKSKATMADITQQYKEENAANLAAGAKALQDSKNETALEKQRSMISDALSKIGMRQSDMVDRDWGTNDPAEIAQQVEQNRSSVANGLAPMNTIPIGQRRATVNALTRNGDVVMTGGDNTKLRAAALDSASGLARILSQADQIGDVLNTDNTHTSQASSKLASMLPWTDTAKAVSQYQNTLGGYVKAEGLSPGLARSVAGQGSAKGAMIVPGDSANQQEDKKLTLTDTALSAIQAKLAPLGQAQKQAIWKEIISSNPRLLNTQKFEPVIQELTGGSGNYNSSLVKGLYNAGGK